MEKKYKITIKGTGQLNGPVIINKSFIIDDQKIAQSFNGNKRDEVITAWLNSNYPGMKIPNIKNFSANMISIDENNEEDSSWWKFW